MRNSHNKKIFASAVLECNFEFGKCIYVGHQYRVANQFGKDFAFILYLKSLEMIQNTMNLSWHNCVLCQLKNSSRKVSTCRHFWTFDRGM